MHGVGSSLRTHVARSSRRVMRASKPRDSKYPVATEWSLPFSLSPLGWF